MDMIGQLVFALLAVTVLLVPILIMMRPLVAGRAVPIRSWWGLRNMRDLDDERGRGGMALAFARIVLAILAAGDGALVFERLGPAAGAAAVLTALLTTAFGMRFAFRGLAVLALVAGLADLFDGSAASRCSPRSSCSRSSPA